MTRAIFDVDGEEISKEEAKEKAREFGTYFELSGDIARHVGLTDWPGEAKLHIVDEPTVELLVGDVGDVASVTESLVNQGWTVANTQAKSNVHLYVESDF